MRLAHRSDLRLVCAVGAVLALAAPASFASGAAPGAVSVTGTTLKAMTRATTLRHLDTSTSLRVTVALKLPNAAALEAYNSSIEDPASPLYREFLTPQQIAERFGPSQADVQQVIDHLTSNGLKVTWTSANRTVVRATGKSGQVETAFGVKLNVYLEGAPDRKVRHYGPPTAIQFFANDREAQLPAAVGSLVELVEGLQNYTQPEMLHHMAAHKSTLPPPYGPGDVQLSYDNAPLYNAGYTGSGRTVGISNWDGLDLTNAGAFVMNFGLPTTLTDGVPTKVTIDNVNGSSTPSVGEGEGDLDPQMVLGQAPLATVIIYSDLGEGTPLPVLSQEVSDNLVDIVSESYGWRPTDATIAACHTQHLMMTAQGITYLCASGDYGFMNYDLGFPYPYPVVDPEVTVVGGTVLTVDPFSGYRYSEEGWSGSGGGAYNPGPFKQPQWQKGQGVITNYYKVFPDISSNASGANGAYQFFYGGTDQVGWTGTSFASPVTAGMVAELEQCLIAQGRLPATTGGKHRLGNINTVLYGLFNNGRINPLTGAPVDSSLATIAKHLNSPNDEQGLPTSGLNLFFYDVMIGNNGRASGRGWDLVSGVGTPDFFNIAVAIADGKSP